ncbi:MAG: threonine aldolase family protein [Hyphomicrobiaceae bacterium]
MAEITHNFYSDTQTKPTLAMREAILEAEVGDEQSDADPTTLALCARVAALLGKESAVFLPSGTMCNEIAINVQCRPGDEVIAARNAHIIGFEAGGPAALSGVVLHPIDCARGIFGADDVASAVRPRSRYAPTSRLVSVEQTVNMGGGAVWRVEELQAVAAAAKAHGLLTHMDGARLMNAVVASGVPAGEHARGFDSIWIDFTKGLGAPIGAVLAGSSQFIADAWRVKQRWGGAMRQSGIAAAMCLHALDHHVERLADDHARAHRIACALEGFRDVAQVLPTETNIVIFDTAPAVPAAKVVAVAEAHGVRILALGPHRIRIVTHLDVDDSAEAAVIAALAAALD